MTNNTSAAASASTDIERVRASMDGLVGAFATDGYVLKIFDFDGARLHLGIEALEGACAECLVPANIMSGLVRETLPDDLRNSQITIDYPTVRH